MPRRLADLGEFEALDPSRAAVVRKFRFSRAGQEGKVIWGIDGEPFDPARMDARPGLNTVEIRRFITDVRHPVYQHLAHFKVLSRARNGNEPLPTDAGWRDTLDLRGSEVARAIMRFAGYRGRYAFHRHSLEHEDMMMANFEVV